MCGKELLYALVIMLGPFTFGTVMGFPNPAKNLILNEKAEVRENPILFDVFNAVTSLFGLFGPFIVPLLLRKLGGSRKKLIGIIALYSALTWACLFLTKLSFVSGIVARAMAGIGIGAYSSISPMFIIEMAPENARGFFGCLNQIAIIAGLIYINVISPALNSYVALIGCAIIFPVLQGILISFIPESPAVARERELSKENKDKESLFQKKYAKGMIIGLMMMFVQQFCGCNAILTNLSGILETAGLNIHPDYQSSIAYCAQLVAVFVGSAVMDRLGRRMVWIISCAILIVFLFIFMLYDRYQWNSSILPLVCIFFYEFGFGVGMGPIPWFIIPEYFDDEIRPLATSIVSSANWIFSFIVIVSFPSMKQKMHLWGTMIVYLIVTIGGLIFGIVYVSDPNKIDDQDFDQNSFNVVDELLEDGQ